MSADEVKTVDAIIATLGDAVHAAWLHQEQATKGHMLAALALRRTLHLAHPTAREGE